MIVEQKRMVWHESKSRGEKRRISRKKKKKVYICKWSLEAGRGGELYEWWSWSEKLYNAYTCFDLNSRRIPIENASPVRGTRDGLLITIERFFFLFPLAFQFCPSHLFHLRAGLSLYTWHFIPYVFLVYTACAAFVSSACDRPFRTGGWGL